MKRPKKPTVSKKDLAQRIEELVDEVSQAREAIATLKEEKEELRQRLAKETTYMVVKFRLAVPGQFTEENVKNAVETVLDERVEDSIPEDPDTWDMLRDMTDVTVTREGG